MLINLNLLQILHNFQNVKSYVYSICLKYLIIVVIESLK